jgi:diguanylate cyclase (GGDEF)-like protein
MISVAHIRTATVCAILALVTSTNLIAQRYTFRQYGSEEGLTNLAIRCLLQDRTGYIWVGTDNGLFRYDGGRFRDFGQSEGLPNTEILGLAESPEGVLWVATQNGVARGGERQFKSVDAGESGSVRTVAFDRLGQMYLEYPSGIVRGVPDGAGSYRFRTVVHAATRGLFVNGEDVWFAKDGDVWRLTGDSAERIGSLAGLPKGLWDVVTQDTFGNLWVRSSTQLYEFPRGQTRFVNRSAGIPHAFNSHLYADRHGRLFVSSDSGVVVLDGAHRTHIDSEHGLPADSMGSILLDREESLWLGTFGSGLIRRLGHGEWLSWKKEDGLLHNSIWAIRRDRAGRVWVGSSGGLSILSPDGRVVHSWTSHNGLAGDRVLAIAEGPAGDLFVGTDPAGISRFSQRGTLLRTYRTESGLTVERVYALAVDRQRRLWAGGPGGCFRSRAPLDATAELKFERMDIPGLAAGTRVQDLLVDEGGVVWLATSRGLARFDGGRWKVFTLADGLKAENVDVIARGQDALWLAYRGSPGITRVRVDGDRLETTHFTKQDGLPSDEAFALAFDHAGQLWVATDNGVDVREPGRWRHYDRDDGLIWNDTDSNAMYIDTERNVWVGTSEGLSRYTASPYSIPDSPPTVVLTSIEGISQEFQAGDQPVLPYTRSSLLIRFSGLNYSSETRTRFRYRLTGFDSDWNETRERSVHFAGLPAGRYVFEVVAAGPNGSWSPVAAQFAFSIKPRWWQSWWFLTICLLMALLLGRAIWRLRVRALVAQKQVLERQVADRTAELRESHRQLEEIAYYDILTSLPNRRMFTEVFRRQLAQARRQGGRFALLLVDLDRFKLINDTFGHDAGDAMLIETAIRLRAVVRESDCAARLGGDEFGILLTAAHDALDIEVVCRRIVDSFAVGIPFKDANLKTTASVGIAMFPDDGDTQESLYKSADLALYEAKRAGRNNYRRYRAETTTRSLHASPTREGS